MFTGVLQNDKEAANARHLQPLDFTGAPTWIRTRGIQIRRYKTNDG